jgi:hypothetical protein
MCRSEFAAAAANVKQWVGASAFGNRATLGTGSAARWPLRPALHNPLLLIVS